MPAGRQREFDEEIALEAAMSAFWANGFSGTSMADLTRAMGINKPSLYAAFGNKEALFVRALTHYLGRHGYPHAEKLQAKDRSLPERLQAYLQSVAAMVCDPALPGGCFVAETTSEAGGHCLPPAAAQAVARINRDSRAFFIAFFRQEAAEGNLAATDAVEVCADYMMTLQFGLAVMARSGAERDALDRVIERSMAALVG